MNSKGFDSHLSSFRRKSKNAKYFDKSRASGPKRQVLAILSKEHSKKGQNHEYFNDESPMKIGRITNSKQSLRNAESPIIARRSHTSEDS
jgi:hypothetical protein